MQERILEILKEAGVLLKGHFLLTSGKHSDTYLQCAKIFQDTRYSEELCKILAEKFKEDKVDLVIGPAIGAIQMSYEVSRQLKVRNLFAERENGSLTLRRSFNIEKGERVLVVEDVITTGGTVEEIIKVVNSFGGVVVGVGSIVDRSGGMADFGCKFESVIKINAQTFEKTTCPLCAEGTKAIKPGSRK